MECFAPCHMELCSGVESCPAGSPAFWWTWTWKPKQTVFGGKQLLTYAHNCFTLIAEFMQCERAFSASLAIKMPMTWLQCGYAVRQFLQKMGGKQKFIKISMNNFTESWRACILLQICYWQTHHCTAQPCSVFDMLKADMGYRSAKEWNPKCCNLHPSLASLGDGLPGRAGSQRDEVVRSRLDQDLNPRPESVNSWSKLNDRCQPN